jgi:2-polyprenyl-3-methyl-5-hydroxy-6-metoxy-1,4-benzoquinol methylase
MVFVSCPLCGKDDCEMLFEAADRLELAKDKFRIVRCTSCGLAYLNPRPEEGKLAGYYPKTYWGGKQRGVKDLFRRAEERLKENYKLKALNKCGIRSGRVLDVGCGRGEFLALLKKRGFQVAGLESGNEAVKRGREDFGLEITNGTLAGADFPENSFDAVTMWHVLEHLPNPREALNAVRKLLKPGGVLLLALPDFGGFQAGFYREAWFGIDAPRHMTHFKRDTLSEMLGRADFKKIQFFPGGRRYETAMLVRSMWPALNLKKLKALEDGRPSKYLYKMLQLILDFALLPAGLIITSTGRGSTFTAAAFKEQG